MDAYFDIMIDFNGIKYLAHSHVDGQLEDGRFVELKATLPHKIDAIMHLIVAMSNSTGGADNIWH